MRALRLVLVASGALAMTGTMMGAMVGCAGQEDKSAGHGDVDKIASAINDPARLEEHRVRDEGRDPATVLKFAGVKAGDKIADLAAGGGYYTALVSRIVGAQGKVYAIDPERIFERFPNARNGFPDYAAKDPRENVIYSVQRLDKLKLDEPLDAVLMVLYYHDTIWTETDRAAMNKAIYDALKPGGVFLVVDHHAMAGASDDVTQELHRMDASIVQPEVMAAGFDLVGTSDALAHPEEDRSTSVFDPSVRGKTDRFVYLFKRPN